MRPRAARAGARLARLGRDRKGSIALLTAITAPVLVMMVGMGVEANNWAVVKLELQNAADLAALAGAMQYGASGAQGAATAAADMAELNGVAGGPTRRWNAATETLTDNQITVQIGPGERDGSKTGVSVSVTQTVPLAFTKVMSAMSAITVRATGWAEVASVQPCLLALGVNGSGISGTGNASITLTGCSARSNAAISAVGDTHMTSSDFFAGGSITAQGNAGYTGTLHPDDGTIGDPYASDAAVQNALAALKPGQGTSFSDKPNGHNTLSPGTYSSWSIKGNDTLQPGFYYVNGDILLGANGSLSGSGVTIVTSGALSVGGNATLTLSAPTAGSTDGIPGVVFAGNSTASSSFGGNASATMDGVIYYPNGNLGLHGNPSDSDAGCLEVIANSVTLVGNSSMAANCSNYGALSFSSNTSAVALVR